MHILFQGNRQIAAAVRFQRLCMELAAYTADEQNHMHIEAGTPHKNVKVLK